MRPGHQRAIRRPLEPLPDIGLVNDAIERPRGIGNRDQHAPRRCAAEKAARPVNGVEHPSQPRCAGLRAIFLAQNTIRGPLGRQNIAHRTFGGAVGLCHRIETGAELVVGLQIEPAEIVQDHLPRRIRHQMGNAADIGIEVTGVHHGEDLTVCAPLRKPVSALEPRPDAGGQAQATSLKTRASSNNRRRWFSGMA